MLPLRVGSSELDGQTIWSSRRQVPQLLQLIWRRADDGWYPSRGWWVQCHDAKKSSSGLVWTLMSCPGFCIHFEGFALGLRWYPEQIYYTGSVADFPAVFRRQNIHCPSGSYWLDCCEVTFVVQQPRRMGPSMTWRFQRQRQPSLRDYFYGYSDSVAQKTNRLDLFLLLEFLLI